MAKTDTLDRYYPQQLHRLLAMARAARLDAEHFGAFRMVVDLMWISDGPIADDGRWIAAQLCIGAKTWTRLRAALMAKGLLEAHGGFLSAAGVNDAIIAHRAHLERARVSGGAGGRKSAQNRQTDRAINRPIISRSIPDRAPILENNSKKISAPAQASLAATLEAPLQAIENRESICQASRSVAEGDGFESDAAPARLHAELSRLKLARAKRSAKAPPAQGALPFGPFDPAGGAQSALRVAQRESAPAPDEGLAQAPTQRAGAA